MPAAWTSVVPMLQISDREWPRNIATAKQCLVWFNVSLDSNLKWILDFSIGLFWHPKLMSAYSKISMLPV